MPSDDRYRVYVLNALPLCCVSCRYLCALAFVFAPLGRFLEMPMARVLYSEVSGEAWEVPEESLMFETYGESFSQSFGSRRVSRSTVSWSVLGRFQPGTGYGWVLGRLAEGKVPDKVLEGSGFWIRSSKRKAYKGTASWIRFCFPHFSLVIGDITWADFPPDKILHDAVAIALVSVVWLPISCAVTFAYAVTMTTGGVTWEKGCTLLP